MIVCIGLLVFTVELINSGRELAVERIGCANNLLSKRVKKFVPTVIPMGLINTVVAWCMNLI